MYHLASTIAEGRVKLVIVVGGMIGLGKTTVAEKLADALGSKVFYENVEGNKILPLFYTASEEESQRKRYPFLLQLEFLNSRFSAIKRALSDNNNVMDRSIYEDWYFAKKNQELGRISDIEMEMYDKLLNNMMEELQGMPKKAPDLMVYLRGSFDTVIKRIKMRGRDFEMGDDLIEYYRFLWKDYDAWVYECYSASPVLTIDMDREDVVHRPEDWTYVLASIVDKLNGLRVMPAVDLSPARA